MAFNNYRSMSEALARYGTNNEPNMFPPQQQEQPQQDITMNPDALSQANIPVSPDILSSLRSQAGVDPTTLIPNPPIPNLMDSLRAQAGVNPNMPKEEPKKLVENDEEEETPKSVASKKEEPKAAAPKEEAVPEIKASEMAPQLADLSFLGRGTIGTNENLRHAEESRDKSRMISGLFKGLDLVTAGLTHSQPVAQDHYEQRIKDANQSVLDFKDQVAQEKQDPNSSVSKGFKDFMKQYGFQVQGDLSAADAETIMPQAFKIYNDKLEAQLKKEVQAEKLKAEKELSKDKLRASAEEHKAQRDFLDQQNSANRDLKRELGLAQKESKFNDTLNRRLQHVNEKITAELASSRSGMGVAKRKQQLVESAEALIGGDHVDLDHLDNREVYEIAKTLDTILSGGVGSVAGTKKLTPETARGWIASALEFATNKRQGAQAGSFIERTQKTLEREKEVATKQIVNAQKKVLSSVSDIKNHPDPAVRERYNDILRAHNLPVEEDNNPDVQKYADDHFKGDYSKAEEFLKHRGDIK